MYCLRDAYLETDANDIARLLTLANTFLVTPSLLFEWEDQTSEHEYKQERVALDNNNRVIGYSKVLHDPWNVKGNFFIQVAVDENHRRKNIGTKLYKDVIDFVLKHNGQQLDTMVNDNCKEGLAFARNFGFEIDNHMFESKLDIHSFNEKIFIEDINQQINKKDIQFLTLKEIKRNEENNKKFYDLYKQLAFDSPDQKTFPDQQAFEKWLLNGRFDEEGQIIAISGERWLGLCSVTYYPEEDSMYHNQTGVIRQFRGLKIAQALKLKSIQYAKKRGVKYLVTNNHSKNEPMLSINKKYGYKPVPGFYKMTKSLI